MIRASSPKSVCTKTTTIPDIQSTAQSLRLQLLKPAAVIPHRFLIFANHDCAPGCRQRPADPATSKTGYSPARLKQLDRSCHPSVLMTDAAKTQTSCFQDVSKQKFETKEGVQSIVRSYSSKENSMEATRAELLVRRMVLLSDGNS